jgi:hypothetical protein
MWVRSGEPFLKVSGVSDTLIEGLRIEEFRNYWHFVD